MLIYFLLYLLSHNLKNLKAFIKVKVSQKRDIIGKSRYILKLIKFLESYTKKIKKFLFVFLNLKITNLEHLRFQINLNKFVSTIFILIKLNLVIVNKWKTFVEKPQKLTLLIYSFDYF